MTSPNITPGLVALVDPSTGRFPDALAPPSVAADKAAAASAAVSAVAARSSAEAAAAVAQANRALAEEAASQAQQIVADGVTAETLPGAGNTGRSVMLSSTSAEARGAIGAVSSEEVIPAAPRLTNNAAGKANGSPTAVDTGQTLLSFGGAPLVYSGGRVKHTPAAGPNSAGYLQADLGAGRKVRRFGATVAWPAGSVGSVAFITPSPAWGTPGAIVSQPAGIHLVVYGNGQWHCDYWSGSGITTYADHTTHGRFSDVRDGVLRPLDVWVDVEASAVRLFFPDGSSTPWITNSHVAEVGQHIVWELYENNGSTDTPAEFGEFWADSAKASSVGLAVTKTQVADLVAAHARTVFEYTAAGSYSGSVPPGCKGILFTGIAPGAGGGSGRRGAAGTVRTGGGAGGSGGVVQDLFIPASALGSGWQVTIGNPGAGGAAVTANDTNGAAGGAGGTTQFVSGSAAFRVLGGGGGGGGGTAASGAGGAGAPNAVLGGASHATGGAGTNGLTNFAGGPGGAGAGGGITTTDAASAGGSGQQAGLWVTAGSAPAGGVVGGALPQQGAARLNARPSDGPGGGAASITGAAQDGATALGHGGGGGGGGASLNGNASGKGGDGGPGYARVTIVRS